jgi:hypothetical protein
MGAVRALPIRVASLPGEAIDTWAHASAARMQVRGECHALPRRRHRVWTGAPVHARLSAAFANRGADRGPPQRRSARASSVDTYRRPWSNPATGDDLERDVDDPRGIRHGGVRTAAGARAGVRGVRWRSP